MERLEPVLAGLGRPYELILVNDASPDGSWQVIQELVAAHPWVRGIDMMRNYGQHSALLCGIRAARGQVVVTMDDDLQHPPQELPTLLAKLEQEGLDVVYGTPQKEPHGLWRGLASQITKLALQAAMGAETARMASAFRAFRTSVREAFADYHTPFVSIDVLLTWGTTRFGAVQVRHDPRAQGTSTYTLRKLIKHAIDMATGFSVVPLRLASYLGFSFTVFGILVLVWAVGRYIYEGGTEVPGFPFLASVIALFSGAQLFALGIIGEYLARMHFRTMNKPPYTVRTRLDPPPAQPAPE